MNNELNSEIEFTDDNTTLKIIKKKKERQRTRVSIHKNKILNADHLSFSDLQIIHIYERQREIKCISNLTMKF